MDKRTVGVLILSAALLVAYQSATHPPPETPTPTPAPVKPLDPDCPDGKCPVPLPPKTPPPRRPWGPRSVAPVGASVGGTVHTDGTAIDCDLPARFHLQNKGGSDGAGLCVFTSVEHAATWADVTPLIGFRDWMTRYPGGGYPQKLDQMIAKICADRGSPKPEYLQVEGMDIDILKRASRAGLMPSVTYSFSPTGRYGGQKIAHMVSLVHADDKHFVILDNNYPGPQRLEWLTPDEFKRVYAPGWAVILLKHGPPPVPRNPSPRK